MPKSMTCLVARKLIKRLKVYIQKVSNSVVCCSLYEGKRQRRNRAQSHHSPSRLVDLLVRNHLRCVPNQMPHAIQTMESEWKSQDRLGSDLQEHWPCSEACGDDCRLQVPAKVGGHQVETAEGVKATAESAAGDTVESGEIPGDLRGVDGEVGSDGPVQALFC